MRLTPPGGIIKVADPTEKNAVVGKEENFYVGRGEHGIG
jgi:hypothetical protein